MEAISKNESKIKGIDLDGRATTKQYSPASARLGYELLLKSGRRGPTPIRFFPIYTDSSHPYLGVLRNFSDVVADLITKDPRVLAQLEWRDLERLLANIFERLGFDVELTPATKDKGRDILLSCEVAGPKTGPWGSLPFVT